MRDRRYATKNINIKNLIRASGCLLPANVTTSNPMRHLPSRHSWV